MKLSTGSWYVALLQPSRGANDWNRDAGLLCLGFRSLGIDSRFVSLAVPKIHESEPRIDATIAQMKDREWWGQWGLEGVVLYSWAAPRYEAVARAITEAGLRCVIKVDCDGYKSPRQGRVRFCVGAYIHLRDARKPFAALQAVMKTALFSLFPAIYDYPMLRHLEHASIIGIESPRAMALLSDLLHRFKRQDLANKLRLIPHPVTEDMKYNPTTPKEKLVVAVARWDAWSKDTPRLIDTLSAFLQAEPEYMAELIGTGVKELERLLRRVSEIVRSRIKIIGPVEHSTLPSYYSRAQAIVFTSRVESGPIAGDEAVCCGCAVVGSAWLPPMHWLCGEGSGTLAADRSVTAMTDALRTEVRAWREGKRDPKQISALWIPRLHASEVAQSILRFCEMK